MGGELMIYRLSRTILRGQIICLGVLWCRFFLQSSEHVLDMSDSQEIQVVVALYFVLISKIFCIKGAEVY